MTEEWKPIKGYEGEYEVSNYGRVRSLDRKAIRERDNATISYKGKLLRLSTIPSGYIKVILHKKQYAVHRLVATAFIPNPENKAEVNHKDGNKTNNCVENLEWCTRGENQKHAFRIGIKRITDSQRELYRRINKHPKPEKYKPVIQYDTEGNEIARFPSIDDASRTTGVKASYISQTIHERQKTAGGYKWRLA